MTDPVNPSAAAAPGWYPTAPGSPTLRWWDGARWSEHFANADQFAPAPVSSVTRLTPVYGVYIWLFTLLPLLSVLALIPIDFASLMELSMRRSLASPGRPSFASSFALPPGYLLAQLLSFVLYAALVVLASLDYKRLGRLGFARRFHWAWGFLTVVYLIGRSVTVRRESGRGLAVIWAYAGVVVVSLIVAGVKVAAAVAAIEPLMQQSR